MKTTCLHEFRYGTVHAAAREVIKTPSTPSLHPPPSFTLPLANESLPAAQRCMAAACNSAHHDRQWCGWHTVLQTQLTIGTSKHPEPVTQHQQAMPWRWVWPQPIRTMQQAMPQMQKGKQASEAAPRPPTHQLRSNHQSSQQCAKLCMHSCTHIHIISPCCTPPRAQLKNCSTDEVLCASSQKAGLQDYDIGGGDAGGWRPTDRLAPPRSFTAL